LDKSTSHHEVAASDSTSEIKSGVAFRLAQREIAAILGITPHAVSLKASKLGLVPIRIGGKAFFGSSAVRQLVSTKDLTYPQGVVAFQMLKGGSTKTSSAFNLAVRLNQYGARVLAVDLDMQGNLSTAFGYQGEGPVFFHVAAGECTIGDTIVRVSENLDLVPSTYDNSLLDYHITSRRCDIRSFVANTIDPLRSHYDLIIVDCNPSLSALNMSIAFAVDRLIIPVNPDRFSSDALSKTLQELDRMTAEFKGSPPIKYNLLFTLYDAREGSSARYLIEYGSAYGKHLIEHTVRRNADVKNALDSQKSIFDFPKAPAREDFDMLATGFFLGWTRARERSAA
jgi:chromosome partitioning protein